MTNRLKIPPTCALLAVAVVAASAGSVFAQEEPIAADKPVVAQPVSFNGYTCDMVRAKVAESGITAAYAYARYMGMTSRDISRVRKACAV